MLDKAAEGREFLIKEPFVVEMFENLLQSQSEMAMWQSLRYERGQGRMSHHCGCSAFIINSLYLIIDQHNALKKQKNKTGEGLLVLLSVAKFQVAGEEMHLADMLPLLGK